MILGFEFGQELISGQRSGDEQEMELSKQEMELFWPSSEIATSQ